MKPRLALLIASSFTFVSVAQAQTVPAGYQAQTVVSGLIQPTTMAFIAPNEILVLEKTTGRVKHAVLLGGIPTIVLDLSVATSSEQGLLGIALHPNFTDNKFVYLYYTNLSPHEHRIERYTWNGTNLVSPTIIAILPATPGPNHDGGIILFGPDGKLYIVIGDLNRDDQTENYAGAAMSDTGVILRLNDDGSTPADNPFTTAGWERYYAYGVRNCFGMTIDPVTGTLWDTENGPSSYDEVNRIVAGGNSGWEDIMGPDSRDPQGIANLVMISGAVYVDPAYSWFSTIAPTGICFMNSCRWPASLRDNCFVSDSNTGSISMFQMNAARDGFVLTGGNSDLVADSAAERDLVRWATGFSALTDLKIGPDGYLYAVSIGAGNIKQVRPINPMGDINLDGDVTLADVPLYTDVLLGNLTGATEIALADFDGDGVPTGLDTACFVESLQMPN